MFVLIPCVYHDISFNSAERPRKEIEIKRNEAEANKCLRFLSEK